MLDAWFKLKECDDSTGVVAQCLGRWNWGHYGQLVGLKKRLQRSWNLETTRRYRCSKCKFTFYCNRNWKKDRLKRHKRKRGSSTRNATSKVLI